MPKTNSFPSPLKKNRKKKETKHFQKDFLQQSPPLPVYTSLLTLFFQKKMGQRKGERGTQISRKFAQTFVQIF